MYEGDMPYSWQEMVTEHKVISPTELLQHLHIAQKKLTETPGIHQAQRQALEPDWIGWWISFLRSNFEDLDSKKAGSKLKSIRRIAGENAKRNEQGVVTANFFASGLEGHGGHRHAVNHIVSILSLGKRYVGILLDEKIAPAKERTRHHLTLQMRMSMWAYYFLKRETEGKTRLCELDYIGIMPENKRGTPTNIFYNHIFVATKAMFHFVMRGDPYFSEKFARNGDNDERMVIDGFQGMNLTDLLVFDEINEPTTTERTRRLLERGASAFE